MTIGEMSHISGVSVRTLHHYDRIGLLKPAATTEAGYRVYDQRALERLHTILLFRELEFPLRDIKRILDQPDFDPIAALDEQITLLTLRREHIDNLILLARGLKMKGLKHMDFSAFDTSKLDEYTAQAKAAWGHTEAYQEYASKSKDRSPEATQQIEAGMWALMARFGSRQDIDPASEEVQAMVQELRDYFTQHFYNCTPVILRYLANMYDGGGDFTRNIDQAVGEGSAAFIAQAIRIYCQQHQQ